MIDAFPYQILGPGHLERLGSLPPGARALPAGRFELSIGASSDWLVDPDAHRRFEYASMIFGDVASHRNNPRVQQRARDLLAPCLIKDNASTHALGEERRARLTNSSAKRPEPGAMPT